MNGGPDAAQTQSDVLQERIEALLRPRVESLVSGMVVGAVLSVALLRVYPWPTVLVWFAGICVVQLGLSTWFKLTWFRPVQIHNPVRAGHRYVLDVAMAGLYWGVSLAFLVRPEDIATQVAMALAIGGMAVGSNTIHAYHRPAMYTFLLCLVLPFALRVLMVDDFIHRYLGVGMLLLIVYLAVYGRVHSLTLERSIWIRHENRSLLAQLQQERETALKLQAIAEAANLSKSRFFAGASHDLRQPLQAMGLYASVLEGSALPTELQQVSHRIGESVRLLEDLFEGVMDTARIEAGGMQIHEEPVDVKQLMDRAMLLFGGEALDKGLSIKCVASKHWVLGDRLALQRVISNLVSNAVRHTQSGRILLGCRRKGAHLRLMVYDTGPGISDASQGLIFEDFFRLESAGGAGFGLGLATVKRLCDAAGYSLGLCSKLNRGSVFWVELPRCDAPEKSVLQVASTSLLDTDFSQNILVVEDDPAARGGLETLLRAWGHSCIAVEDGDQAILLVRQQPEHWSVVISDYNLPGGMNGLALIEILRTVVPHPLNALLISGAMDQSLHEQAQAMGVIAMAKPVRPIQLRSVLTSMSV
ncbi:MAG: integral membrane sensor hybrid histidine kinase [Comamonadaceae bacterium]|nr:MAG: integral membrane sensor hybrid histidine kinase [Comamonadaceae bacterium]